MKMSGKTASAAAPCFKRRVELLDELRGACVLCMLFYHGFFLAGDNFDISIFKSLFSFFMPAQPFFASLFIFISGISSRLSRNNLYRGLRLAAVTGALSVTTSLLFPLIGIGGMSVLFGILHAISLSILIFTLIRPIVEKINPALGFFVCFFIFAVTYGVQDGVIYLPFKTIPLPQSLYSHYYLFPLGFKSADFYSADYFPLLPNLFIFLAGGFVGGYVAEDRIPSEFYEKHVPFLGSLGRRSLLIYAIHWPIIYILLYLTAKLSERF